MFVMLWNLSVISHWIFPLWLLLVFGAKSKNNLRGYVTFYGNTIEEKKKKKKKKKNKKKTELYAS